MKSPYQGISREKWEVKTDELIAQHPLKMEEIVSAVLKSWKQIFASQIGPLKIGIQIFPSPQLMSNILHELIPYNILEDVNDDYKVGTAKDEKDVVYIPNKKYSIEIKASSSKNDIYTNRNYAQPALDSDTKNKNGYYIGVNFEKFKKDEHNEFVKVQFDANGILIYPKITQIKFGYLEHTDWRPQSSAKGQQARLTKEAKKFKLKKLYPKS